MSYEEDKSLTNLSYHNSANQTARDPNATGESDVDDTEDLTQTRLLFHRGDQGQSL
jgi:hypothetical protein